MLIQGDAKITDKHKVLHLNLKTIQDILQIPFLQGHTDTLLNFAAFLFWTLHGDVLFWDSTNQNKILQFHFFMIGP